MVAGQALGLAGRTDDAVSVAGAVQGRNQTSKREPPSGPSGDTARTFPPMAAANSATMASPSPEPIGLLRPRSAW